MSDLVKKIWDDKLGIFIGLILTSIMFYLTYTYYQSRQKTVIVTDTYNSYAVTKGKSFLLCRDVIYTKRTKLEIERALVQQRNMGKYTMDFPKIFVDRDKGEYKICREIYVPKTICNGKWTLETTLIKHTSPFWRFAYKIKPINLYIKDK